MVFLLSAMYAKILGSSFAQRDCTHVKENYIRELRRAVVGVELFRPSGYLILTEFLKYSAKI